MDRNNPSRDSRRLAVVTGASSGIGEAIATRLAQRGYRTLLLARRVERLESLARKLTLHAPSVAVPVDLSDRDAVETTLPALLATHGSPDVLINNAGYGLYRPFLEHTPADIERLMQVNYFSPMAMIRIALPGMLKRGNGHVINIASMAAKIGPWGHAGYAAAKAALVSATQTLAAEHAGEGVYFSYVNPGIVSTAYFDTDAIAPLAKRVQRHAVSPEFAAERILSLLNRPRLELCIPRHYRFLDFLRALSPTLAHALVARSSRPAPMDVPSAELAQDSEQREA